MEPDAPTMTGREVADTNLAKIGTVTDVLYDDVEMEPRWAVVKVNGLFDESAFFRNGTKVK